MHVWARGGREERRCGLNPECNQWHLYQRMESYRDAFDNQRKKINWRGGEISNHSSYFAPESRCNAAIEWFRRWSMNQSLFVLTIQKRIHINMYTYRATHKVSKDLSEWFLARKINLIVQEYHSSWCMYLIQFRQVSNFFCKMKKLYFSSIFKNDNSFK